jgi:hypothetical protein
MNFLRQAVAYAALAAALQPAAAAQATSSNTACGLAADRAAVEAAVVDRFRTESRHPLDATYILHLVALRGWARVDVESKGEFTEWFALTRGRWTFQKLTGSLASADPPASLPRAIAQRLNVVDRTNVCPGPHFKNHPSGP